MNTATWTIKRLAMVMACVGLLALSSTLPAEAADASSNATGQVQWCQSMGGTASVTEDRSVADGVRSVSVICTGGLNGSWNCHNFGDTVDCASGRGSPFDWSDLVNGQILAPVASSPTSPDASPSVAAPDDDQDQDKDNGKKSKKHKKGKKGGKGRK